MELGLELGLELGSRAGSRAGSRLSWVGLRVGGRAGKVGWAGAVGLRLGWFGLGLMSGSLGGAGREWEG